MASDAASQESEAAPANAIECVSAALQSEADGDLVARDRLLTQAAKQDNDCAMAQWHRGWLQDKNGQWRSIDDLLAKQNQGDELSKYEARRDLTPAHAAGQWDLALWCLRNGFADQGRAHVRRTIELAPDHTQARRLLGFRLVDGEWISAAQQAEIEARAGNIRAGLIKYGKQLKELARAFGSRQDAIRTEARDALTKIEDPLAIAPVEAVLGTAGSDAAQAAVDWLASMDDPEATMSIARLALFHPLASVKEAAVAQIKTRPLHDYVPVLLDSLASPVAALAVPVVGTNGTLTGFRQAFAQERQGKTDFLVVDTRIEYSAQPDRVQADRAPSNRRPRLDPAPRDPDSQREAIGRASQRVSQDNATLRTNNQRIVLRNQLVASFLSEVADEEFSGEPSQMWKWWDETNEAETQGLKPSNVRYTSSRLVSRNYTELAAAAAARPTLVGECFARGTPVITRRGAQAIETIRVGDMVLSRDVPTGELSWKSVVRTTIRPPSPVFDVVLDNESLRCTGGHLFWVSGKGWTKASQLRPADILHAASQPVVVLKVFERPQEQTFNLAVEQTQTYFVGKQMVMTHDVTDRVPTHIKVPGLSRDLLNAPVDRDTVSTN